MHYWVECSELRKENKKNRTGWSFYHKAFLFHTKNAQLVTVSVRIGIQIKIDEHDCFLLNFNCIFHIKFLKGSHDRHFTDSPQKIKKNCR